MTKTLHPPPGIKVFNAIAKPLLAAGMPLGPNGLLTVRGRKSGVRRTTPLAFVEVDGRRWVWSPWGEVQWVQNLRASGQATIEVRRKTEGVTATELNPTERVAFFRDVLGPLARSRRGGVLFIRAFDGVDINDPVKAAEGRTAFELHPAIEPIG